MKADINISTDSTAADAAALQLYMANTLTLDTRAKEAAEKLVEKILDAMNQKVQVAPTEQGKDAVITSTRDHLVALKDNATVEQAPILDAAIQSLNNQIKETSVVVAKPKSRKRQMGAAVGAQAQILIKSGNKVSTNPPVLNTPTPPAKFSSGDSSVPAPSLPPSGCPPLPGDDSGTDWQMTDVNGAIMKFFLYLNANPTDPTAMMKLMNFLASGKVTPAIMQMIDQNCTLMGNGGGIATWANTMAQYSFFAGYTHNGVYEQGGQAMKDFLSDIIGNLSGGPQNKYTEEMLRQLNKLNNPDRIAAFIDSHTAGTGPGESMPPGTSAGDLYWTYDGYTYNWTNPGTAATNDQDMIQAIMNGQSVNGQVNPWVTSLNILAMNQMYRVQTLNQLLKEFKDPLFAISLWILTSCDTTTEADISAKNVTTSELTQGTGFANNLADAISAFSSGNVTDPAIAAEFMRGLMGGEVFFNEHPQMQPIQANFDTGVLGSMNSIQVPVSGSTSTPPATMNLGDALQQWMGGATTVAGYSSLTAMLNGTFGDTAPAGVTPQPVTPGSYTPNQNAQTAANTVNQFTSLVTGQSKTESTEIATDTNTDSAIMKTGDALTSMVKMNEKVVAHYND